MIERMQATQAAVTILHLSDLQLGAKNRFGGAEALLTSLGYDLDDLGRQYGLQPDLLVITGDLSETAMPSELADCSSLVNGLLKKLGLGRERLVVVHGNHDISWKMD